MLKRNHSAETSIGLYAYILADRLKLAAYMYWIPANISMNSYDLQYLNCSKRIIV